MRKSILSRRLLTGAAVLTLGFGVVACAETEEAVETGADVVSSAAEEAGSAVRDATDGTADAAEASEEAAEPTEPDAEPAEGEAQVETEGGAVAIPAAAASALESFTADWGVPESIETNDLGQVLARFQEGNVATWAEELGAVPIVGKIAETWLDEGGLASGLGLPTGPEQAAPEGNGWIQEFANGAISWLQGEDGEFTADVQQN